MKSDATPPPSRAMLARARRWIARRDAGLDATDRAELKRWLAADPAHRRALLEADPQRSDVDWALRADAVDDVLAVLEHRARARRNRRTLLAGAACAAALALVATLRREPAVVAPAATSANPALATLTAIEPRQLALADGSVAVLRADAQIAVNYSAGLRRITLVRGAAHFQVKPDARRPFIVSSGALEVRAVGTAFAVEDGATETDVIVTEGRVTVEEMRGPTAAAAKVYVGAGERVSIPDRPASSPVAAESLAADELQRRLAWRLPLLQFAGTPLAEIVAAMNRHNRIQLVLTDPAIGGLQLSGTLRADKIAALQNMLEADFALETERRGNTIEVRRRK